MKHLMVQWLWKKKIQHLMAINDLDKLNERNTSFPQSSYNVIFMDDICMYKTQDPCAN